MLKSIKEKLRAAEAARTANAIDADAYAEDIENQGIMECAKIFQELDDLSINGTELNERRNIDVLDIGFDDVELESFEISANDGRILDIPADVLVHSESYEEMKSFEDFYTEAYNTIDRIYTESTDEHAERAKVQAVTEYKTYLGKIYQEGLFSASKIALTDPTVQWYRTVNLGPSDPSSPNSSPYTVRLDIAYQSKNGKSILTKQRDTIPVLFDNIPDTLVQFGSYFSEELSERGFKIPEGKTIWDVCIPKRIIVPEQPLDQFVFYIEAENIMSSKNADDALYVGFGMPISGIKEKGFRNTDSARLDKKHIDLLNSAKLNIIDQKNVIRESFAPKVTRSIGRVIEEGVDFGGSANGDNPPDPNGGDASQNNDTPPADNGGGDAVDNTTGDATGDATGDDANSETSTEPTADENKTEVNSNDLSPQIAEKVQEKQNEAEEEKMNEDLDSTDGDLPTEDEFTDNPDMETDDGESEESTDDKLAALDDIGDDELEDGSTDEGTMDITSMSPNDLVDAAKKKFENMSIEQIQKFLSDDPTGVQEAFFLTKKNINAELDASLRNCLGALNDSSKEITEIVGSFKKDGKKLNRALSKASKMKDVYDSNECEAFIKLNKCLADLLVIIKPDADKKEVQVIKRLMKSFVSQAAGVGKIIDKHKTDKIDSTTPVPSEKKKSISRRVD